MTPLLAADAAARSLDIPVAWIAPFALLLLAIAVLPLAAPHRWERNRTKGAVSAALALPVAAWLLLSGGPGPHWLLASLEEYVSFIALLGALFVISGGIHLRGSLAGTPLVNTAFLAVGALIASVVGTTGASMLLIRPLLRANEARARRAHIVVFFIFVVSNAGGLLTPLGDPPLFLGFLRGVPFFWTSRLLAEWALVNAVLLVVFNVLDQATLNREERERPGSQLEEVQKVSEPLRVDGALNFAWLFGVVATNYAVGTYGGALGLSETAQKAALVLGMAAMTLLSLWTTPAPVRAANRFGWGPIVEVAVLFAGIFVTMVPALRFLEHLGASGQLKIEEPWQFFWLTGGLSSFLDNAPTYVTFSSLASGVFGTNAADLGQLAAHAGAGPSVLAAISCGAVFMGANTYIGNGPNFMVKAIAEENRVRMPSFFGYMAWSAAVLLPLFLAVTFLFFRS